MSREMRITKAQKERTSWKLEIANLRFHELFRRACIHGPQYVVPRGEAVVVTAAEDYERLTKQRRRPRIW